MGSAKELKIPPDGERRLILNPPPSKRGYLKRFGPTNGYFLISIKGERVTVSFDIIGGKKEWEFYWEKPGEIIEIKAPTLSEKFYLKPEDIKDIIEARIYVFPYTPEIFFPEKSKLEIFFNGEKIGILPTIVDWVWGGKNFINVPTSLVKMKNEIDIPNPRREAFGLRDCCLCVKLKDGREISTEVYPYVLFSLPWRQIYMNFGLSHPSYGVLGSSIEENVPNELIKCVKLGKPVSFELEFHTEK